MTVVVAQTLLRSRCAGYFWSAHPTLHPQRAMNLDTIQTFFTAPPPTYLNTELAVCFVVSVLLQQDTCITAFVHHLQQTYPAYDVSDTILYRALTFLETEGAVRKYWQRGVGRGRPRQMFTLVAQHREQATTLTQLWYTYVDEHPFPGGLSAHGSRQSGRAL